MKKTFIGVIGERNAGKSTIIRALTGCDTKSFRGFVEDLVTGDKIYVIASSPQESELSLDEFIDILNKVLNDNKCLGIVMAIQPSKPRVRIKIESIYIEVNKRNKFSIYAFVIDPSRNNGATSQNIVNGVAGRISAIKVNPISLNGNTFAFLNADKIRKATNIF